MKVACRRADLRVLEDLRVGTAELPRREERRPVDALDKLRQRVVLERSNAEEGRPRWRDARPVQLDAVGTCFGDGQAPLGDGPLFPLAADLVVLLSDFRRVGIPPLGVHERTHNTDGARGIADVDDRAAVRGRDLDRGVRP